MVLILSTSARWMIESSRRPDMAELLHRVGLDIDDAPAKTVDAAEFYDIVETIVADGEHDLAFRAAETLSIDSYGALGLAFKTSPDIRSALGRIERYGALVSDAIQYELRPNQDGGAAFAIVGRPASRTGVEVMNEAALAGVVAFCRQASILDELPAPVSVSFTHARPGLRDGHESYFDCPVEFDAEVDEIRMDVSFLETRIRLADPALTRFLSDQLDDELAAVEVEPGIDTVVRQVIADRLADGTPTMSVVARCLAMSERTLRRRLSAEDLRYEDVVAAVQRANAEMLLTTTEHPLVDTAFLVGYADQTAFQRADKRWTGDTPRQARRRARAIGRNGQSLDR